MTKHEFETHAWGAKDKIVILDELPRKPYMVTAVDFEQGLVEYSYEGGYRNTPYAFCELIII